MIVANPFRPGAGHPPPYLAGRVEEGHQFDRLLGQDVILENLVLTGLRGVGKTVLLETFRPKAVAAGWLWAGTDMSESASVSEDQIAVRLLTDLAVATGSMALPAPARRRIGFRNEPEIRRVPLDFHLYRGLYDRTPGLVADKLKAVLDLAWECASPGHRGIVFAYDEAQNLADQPARAQYPLSLLLEVFQSLQKRGMRFLLVLVGLPTLFPKLVDARTFAERMFRVVFVRRLSEADSELAIRRPIEASGCPFTVATDSVRAIVKASGGYPYFIQFFCREAFDVWVAQHASGRARLAPVPLDGMIRKLDADFFAGRWARLTDRQRDLLHVVARLEKGDDEFTVQEVVEKSREMLAKGFSSSHVNQMLASLSRAGLVYKNRHGRYSFAVPLFGAFVLRQVETSG